MELDLSPGRLVDRIARAMRRAAIDELDATGLATALTGDSIAANLLVVGYALQKGLLPVSLGALEQAIRLNGVAVKANLAALAWGRLAAEELAKVRELAAPVLGMGVPAAAEDLATLVDRRAAFLADYQDAAYAARYRRLVERAAEAERCQVPGRSGFAEAVARGLFKLMAYKDEYEVARLYTGAEFRMQLERQFEGNFRLSVHLAPPLLARLDANGRPQKAEYGRWMFTAFRLLARLRRLRGTRLDLFGYTEERRMERRLVAEYEATVVELCNRLDPRTHKLARDIALLPEQMRGFGHVKRGNVERAKAEEARLLDQMRRAAEPLRAAG
jgi:indolepyruvate ferredoxin oxidoreductase